MYPNSPYAIPYPSFKSPVVPPNVDPNGGELHYVGINCEWFPYIIGALKQLLLQATWSVSTDSELDLIQQRAFTLLSLFDCANTPTLAELQNSTGSGGEDMCCCIRVENGVIQTLSCGVWIDVPGQPPGGFFNPGQPGNGTPQPQPGGGCQTYHGKMGAQGSWYLPALVSDGDTIQVSNITGAWNGGDISRWYCGDGERFVAGACIGLGATDAGDPLPTALHMAMIGLISSTYVDLTTGLITVSGVGTNQQVTFQPNDSVLGDNSGDIEFDVTVCNNQTGAWQSSLDFTANPYSSFVNDSFGTWAAGTGYTGGVNGSVPNWCQLDLTLDSFDLDSLSMVYDSATPGGTSNVVFFEQNATGYGTPGTPVDGGPFTYSVLDSATGVTALVAVVSTGTTGGIDHIRSLLISGHGPKPSQLP